MTRIKNYVRKPVWLPLSSNEADKGMIREVTLKLQMDWVKSTVGVLPKHGK